MTTSTSSNEKESHTDSCESVDLLETDGVTKLTWTLTFRTAADRAHWRDTDGLEANFDNVEDVVRSLLEPEGATSGR